MLIAPPHQTPKTMKHISLFSFILCGTLLFTGCQNDTPSDPIQVSQKTSDPQIQELAELVNKFLSAENAPYTPGGRELEALLITNPTDEDFKKYPNYRYLGETESGMPYMFLVGDHALEAALDASGLTLFGKAVVPNNPACRGNANLPSWALVSYFTCVYELTLECNTHTIRVGDEYHTYALCD